ALDIAGAYSTFGNGGIYNEPYAVKSVVYGDGREEDLTPDPVAAMSDATAYMVTDMLRSVMNHGEGTGRQFNIPSLPVVGKTGTTDDNVDSWFAGYTNNYTISIWSGYEDSTKPIPPGFTSVPRQMFRDLMIDLSAGIETADFDMPDSVVRVQV